MAKEKNLKKNQNDKLKKEKKVPDRARDDKKELAELDDKYKRALADYQNLLKRTADEKAEFAKYASEQLLLDILPVYNNLKISMKHVSREAENNGWAEGIKYIIKQFEDVLKLRGVEEIKTVGEKFDPNTMEAIKGDGEKVKEEVSPGYKLSGKVIMPAKVIL